MRTWIACLLLSACFIKPNPQAQGDGGNADSTERSDGKQGSGSGNDPDEAGGYDPSYNVMFMTSQPFAANNGTQTIGKADDFCMAAAGGKIPGDHSFQAWLSLPLDTVASRMNQVVGGWKRVDGRPFASSFNDLIAGKIFHPPLIDENGNDVRPSFVGNPIAMTATVGKGTPQNPEACGGFTANGTSNDPLYGGVAWATTEDWSHYVPTNGSVEEFACDNPVGSIYCFEVSDHETRPVPNHVGRRIWVSRTMIALPTTPEAADAVCSGELPGAIALLATTADSPARHAMPGPYIRPDGAFVADDGKLDTLVAPINVQLDGEYVTGPIWLGSPSLTVPGSPAQMCGDTVMGGRAMLAEWVEQGVFTQPCATPLPLICLDNN